MTSWVRFHKHLLEFTKTSSNYSFIYNVLLGVESMQQCHCPAHSSWKKLCGIIVDANFGVVHKLSHWYYQFQKMRPRTLGPGNDITIIIITAHLHWAVIPHILANSGSAVCKVAHTTVSVNELQHVENEHRYIAVIIGTCT